MGSSISHFDITLDDEYGQNELLPILAGSTIRGKVQMELTSPIKIPQTRNSSHPLPVLQLRMYGKEKVRMNPRMAHRIHSTATTTTGGSTMNGTTKTTSSYVAEREFLSIPLDWSNFPTTTTAPTTTTRNSKQTIPKGSYSFPFQIQLPISIPSSTYYPKTGDRSQMSFRIQYKIMATLQLPNYTRNTNIPVAPTKKTVRYLWIAAVTDPRRIPTEPVPIMVQPIAMELKNAALFFQQKGIFMFGASIENTQLFVNTNDEQIIALHVSCRNDSSIQIQRVQITLMEKLVWNTVPTQSIDPRTGSVLTTSIALRQVLQIPIVVMDNVQLPGLVKQSKGLMKSMMEGVFGTAQQNLQRQVYNDLISGENLIPITIPSNCLIQTNNPIDDDISSGKHHHHHHRRHHPSILRESYQGQLIQVSHFIKIVFNTGTFCQTPTLEIPIQLLPNPSTTNASPPHHSTTCDAAAAGVATYQPPPSTTTTTTTRITNDSTKTTTLSVPTPEPTTNGLLVVEDTTTTSGTTSSGTDHMPIPMASAVIVPTTNHDDRHQYEANEAISDVIVLGGDAIIQQQQQSSRRGLFHRRRPIVSPPRQPQTQTHSSNANANQAANNNSTVHVVDTRGSTTTTATTTNTNLSSLVPLSAPTKHFENAISIPALLSSMRSSMVDDYEYIQSKLCEPVWVEVFHNMSSNDYGSVVANVHEFDQPRVALLLAPFINHQHGGCNCEYAASAVRHTSHHHRAITAQKLIPWCTDIRTNHTVILDELNGWEQTITESVLAEAMRN